HITPAYEAGEFTGYLALYRPAPPAQVARRGDRYARFRQGTAGPHIILRGKILRDSLLHRLNPLWNLSLKARLLLLAGFPPVLTLACFAMQRMGLSWNWIGIAVALGSLASLYSGLWLGRDVADRLTAAKVVFRG
ncbi:hypothetical protein ABTL54_19855, partial [Acinetobacter baumannii]